MKTKILHVAAYILVITLFFGILGSALPKNIIEPPNPMNTEVSELRTNAPEKSGAHNGIQDGMQLGEEQENSEQDETEQEENESEEEDEPEEEEMKEEQEEQSEEEPPEQEPPENEQPEDEEQGENTPEDNSKEISEEQLPESEENPEEAKKDGNGESGEPDEKNPEKDEEGEIPTEGGSETEDEPGTGEAPGKDEHGLVTDLYDRIILFSELEDDTLDFYAYYSDSSVDSNVRVNYKHKEDTGNGTWLEKSGDHNYSTKLSLGKNYITIYYTDENGVRNWARITLTYQADKADESDPVKGQNPPIIKTNLDGWNEDIKIFEFTFTVDAKKYNGQRIYSDNIQVWLDGRPVTNPTGSGIYEYVLEFGMPVEGQESHHKVSVLAWDDEGNSRYVQYSIRHVVHDEGVSIGTVTVEIDVTTLGLGIIDEGEVTINSGDTAAVAVIRMLEEYGYEFNNTGTLETDFYLSSISRADAFSGAKIDERLERLIERDGITFLPNSGRDKLGEHDYTRGSGWMYFINGDLCPGKSMSSYKLNGGEKIALRFTLAYGKDVGSSFSDGSTSLTSYCAKWVNGTIIEYDHSYQEDKRVEATPDEEGYILYVCKKCKEEKKENLPYEGEEVPEPEQPNPEQPNPEQPEPEQPNPEQPEPEQPEPEQPEPEQPNPEQPEPEQPEPEQPKPEQPEPEQPEPEQPEPEQPEPEQPNPEQPEPEQPEVTESE